jgi:hypothetical protein
MSELYDRVVADKRVDEAAWLSARRGGVTATEVAKLAKGSAGYSAGLVAEKKSGKRTFFGNKYTDWGLAREEVLVNSTLKFEGFVGTDTLFHAAENRRHLATPDGLYTSDGSLFTAEIKTGKHDLTPGSDFFEGSGYRDQIQWQMYVCGVDSALYVWEQHDDVWRLNADSDVLEPTPFLACQEWLGRDQKRIDELILIANDFLALLDGGAVADDPADYEELGRLFLVAREARDAAVERMDAVSAQIVERIGDRDSFTVTTSLAKVTFSTPKPTERFDSATFKKAHPDIFPAFVRVTQSKPSLRITALKETNNDIF